MNLAELLNQKATWWEKTGQDGYGKPTFAAPVSPIMCRWEDWRSLLISPTMEEVRITARVFLDFAPGEGDYLYLGISTVANPLSVLNARAVLRVTGMTSVDGLTFLYTAAVFSS
jgi:hypothetical protein